MPGAGRVGTVPKRSRAAWILGTGPGMQSLRGPTSRPDCAALSLPSRIVIAVAACRRRGRRRDSPRDGVPARRAVEHGHQAARRGDRATRSIPSSSRTGSSSRPTRSSRTSPSRPAPRSRTADGDRADHRLDRSDRPGRRGHPPATRCPATPSRTSCAAAWDFFVNTHDAQNRPIGLRGELSERYIRRIVMLRLDGERDQGGGRSSASRSARRRRRSRPPPWSDGEDQRQARVPRAALVEGHRRRPARGGDDQ